jgi:hypothetical protein
MPREPRVPSKGKGTAKRPAPPARTDRPYVEQLAERVHAATDYLVASYQTAEAMWSSMPAWELRRQRTKIRKLEAMLDAMLHASHDVVLDEARRVALMAHLDRCLLASDATLKPLPEVVADGGMAGISAQDVAALLPSWAQRKGGAKPSDGSKGRGPKWDQLATLIARRWGDATRSGSLRKEYENKLPEWLAAVDPGDDAT